MSGCCQGTEYKLPLAYYNVTNIASTMELFTGTFLGSADIVYFIDRDVDSLFVQVIVNLYNTYANHMLRSLEADLMVTLTDNVGRTIA